MRGLHTLVLVASFALVACGGSAPPPEEPAAAEPIESNNDVEQEPIGEAAGEKASKPDDEGGEAAPGEAKPVAEPQFTENMSVNDAMKAVPLGTPTLNIEPETMALPLQDPKVYEPCKMGNAHFKLKVAVWEGKAVGVDVTTTPKNDKLAECVKTQIRSLTWKDKVKSLNTVEYAL